MADSTPSIKFSGLKSPQRIWSVLQGVAESQKDCKNRSRISYFQMFFTFLHLYNSILSLSMTKKIAVIGVGNFGAHLCETLARQGAEVMAIDNNINHLDDVKDKVTFTV
jgi:glutamate dehydrogenase/leucine dehydrogenase